MENDNIYSIDRIGNIDLRRSHNYIEIVKWQPNDLYNKQDQYGKPDANGLCESRTDPCIKAHEDCFKYPEYCYVIASWDLADEEPDLRYCGRRPLDLMLDEYEVFEQLVREGYEYIERNKENS